MEKKIRRFIELALTDALILIGTLWLGIYFIKEINIFTFNNSFWYILLYISINFIFLSLFSLYNLQLAHVGFNEVIRVVLSVIVSQLIFFVIQRFTSFKVYDMEIVVFIAPLQILLMAATRFSKRIYKSIFSLNPNNNKKYIRTLIIGAGSAGKLAYDEIYRNASLNNKVVGFIDDDKSKVGTRLNGILIYGPIDNINKTIELLDIQEVIIAISDIDKNRLREIVELVSKNPVKLKRLPLNIEDDFSDNKKIIDVNIEDLLDRGVIKLDNDGLSNFLYGKSVLVTGGGGSIGSELCEQILSFNPRKLVIFDIYENTTYETQLSLLKRIRENGLNVELYVLIGSVYNYERIKYIFDTYKPEIVFHAAAYKHVPLMEDSAVEAVRTNVIGTYNVSKLCDLYNVKKMILVSSDKAVRPTNIMGATKAVCEKIIQYFNDKSKTNYSAVRFGNVLGSHGSVVPLFKKQISEGGPVTITHPEITRFFMTIPEAVSLILQSAVYANGGEIFILDMGEPVKIVDLARKMIRLSGYIPDEEIAIKFVGLRPGEKLYEELLVDKTINIKTQNEKIFIEVRQDPVDIEKFIELVNNSIDKESNSAMKEIIHDLIKTYVVHNGDYEN